MPRTAEIIAVGSELLTGGVTNTNAAFLSRLLTAAGVEVLYHTTVDDDAARLANAHGAGRWPRSFRIARSRHAQHGVPRVSRWRARGQRHRREVEE